MDRGVFSGHVIQKIDWIELEFATATSKQKNMKENLEKYKREKEKLLSCLNRSLRTEDQLSIFGAISYQYRECILFATNKILDLIDKFAKQIPYEYRKGRI